MDLLSLWMIDYQMFHSLLSSYLNPVDRCIIRMTSKKWKEFLKREPTKFIPTKLACLKIGYFFLHVEFEKMQSKSSFIHLLKKDKHQFFFWDLATDFANVAFSQRDFDSQKKLITDSLGISNEFDGKISNACVDKCNLELLKWLHNLEGNVDCEKILPIFSIRKCEYLDQDAAKQGNVKLFEWAFKHHFSKAYSVYKLDKEIVYKSEILRSAKKLGYQIQDCLLFSLTAKNNLKALQFRKELCLSKINVIADWASMLGSVEILDWLNHLNPFSDDQLILFSKTASAYSQTRVLDRIIQKIPFEKIQTTVIDYCLQRNQLVTYKWIENRIPNIHDLIRDIDYDLGANFNETCEFFFYICERRTQFLNFNIWNNFWTYFIRNGDVKIIKRAILIYSKIYNSVVFIHGAKILIQKLLFF